MTDGPRPSEPRELDSPPHPKQARDCSCALASGLQTTCIMVSRCIVLVLFISLAAYSQGLGNLPRVLGVAHQMIKLFSDDEEHTKDLSAAEEVIKGIPFEKYFEDSNCRVLRGIPDENFERVLNNLMDRFSMPEDTQKKLKSSLLDVLLVNKGLHEIMQSFHFEKEKGGNYVYGRVAVARKGGEIDMAHSIYQLEFQLAPKIIEHRRTKKFLGFISYGTKVWQEKQKRDLFTSDLKFMDAYFKNKAIAAFQREYRGLLKAEQEEYCTAESCE